jgi:FMN-dependent NADH-azoreductase
VTSLLAIDASPRLELSVSRRLTAKFMEGWKSSHPGGTILTRDLMKSEIPLVNQAWIAGAFSSPDQHSPETTAAIRVSDELIAELKAVDAIVISTPIYNFSIPAVLKAWIDQIVRVGVTFTLPYRGLLTGKKATVILASASDFGAGSPYEAWNVAGTYLKQILAFIGIDDVTVILAGGTLAVDAGARSFTDLALPIEHEIARAARA